MAKTCEKCGALNGNTFFKCRTCGAPFNDGQSPVRASMERGFNWLWPAVVSTLCCCLPLGVVGIVFAAKANAKFDAGDYVGGHKSAQQAKLYTMLSFVLGILFGIIYMIIEIQKFPG